MLTHHAYYIEDSLARFGDYAAKLSPLWSSAFERFGVDEARELIALASLKNFAQATYFVGASSITSEAQQALLKLLEEPQEGTTFVLLVPHGALLPTLKSRMLPFPQQTATQKVLGSPRPANQPSALLQARPDHFADQSAVFLHASGKERSDMIAAMLKDDEGVKDRVRDFVNSLEAALAAQKPSERQRQALEDIAMVRTYLGDRSPSLKMLLEHLAIALLPQ